MKTTSITSKGQVVVPSEIRKKHGLRAGTRIMILERDGQIVLIPVTRNYIQGLAGIISSESKILNTLLESRKEDSKKGK